MHFLTKTVLDHFSSPIMLYSFAGPLRIAELPVVADA